LAGINVDKDKWEKELNNIVGEYGLDDIEGYFEDVVSAKYVYIYTIISCIVVTVVYCILLKLFAKLIIWLSIIATGVGMVALALFCQQYKNANYGVPNTDKAKNLGNALQVTVYVLYSMAGIYFLIILCLFRNIATSIAVL